MILVFGRTGQVAQELARLAPEDLEGGVRAAEAGRSSDPIADGLDGMSVLTMRHDEETAAAIALMMREVLERRFGRALREQAARHGAQLEQRARQVFARWLDNNEPRM